MTPTSQEMQLADRIEALIPILTHDAADRLARMAIEFCAAAPAPSPDRPGQDELDDDPGAWLAGLKDGKDWAWGPTGVIRRVGLLIAEIDRLTAAASPDPARPTREQIARTAYEARHGSWGDITDGLREMYLAEADAVLALFGAGASPVPQPDPPSDLSAYEDAWNAAYWSRVDDVRTIGDASPTVLVELSDEELGRIAFEAFFADPYATSWPRAARAVRDALAEKEADR